MTDLDCRTCRDYRGCIGKDFYTYADIRFCPLQCIWILEHRATLKGGEWPKDPYMSDDNQSSRRIQTEAPFVKPEVIIGELESRLKRCGPQAELLITQVEDGRSLETLSPGAREVLMYVKGYRRKDMTFGHWRKQFRYRMTTKRVHLGAI